MELYYVLSIIDKSKADEMFAVYRELQFSAVWGNIAGGTATGEHLSLYDLQATEKVVLSAVASAKSVKKLFKLAQQKMFIDIPGNGIMLSLPVKSVGGKKVLSYLTKGQDLEGGIPKMEFENELIIAIINEGYSDDLMDAARAAGAAGGTVLHAKGTGHGMTEKFLGVSLAKNKDMVYILAEANKKADIMKAIGDKCSKAHNHPAEAICFSLPVSDVTGLRKLDDEKND